MKPTAPTIASTVEKHNVIPASCLVFAQGIQDGPRGSQIILVQGLVLSSIAIRREHHDVRPGEGEFVGDEYVAGANVAHFEAGGADVASLALGLCVAGVSDGGFPGQGVGEEETELKGARLVCGRGVTGQAALCGVGSGASDLDEAEGYLKLPAGTWMW